MSGGAALAAALLALEPRRLGGVLLRGPPSPARDRWLERFRALLPPPVPLRRIPAGTTAERLGGGLDLTATLALGRPVLEPGLLPQADGGYVVIPGAERQDPAAAAAVASALDQGAVRVERDGVAARLTARIAVVALDESEPDEGGVGSALAERLALWPDLTRPVDPAAISVETIGAARGRLPTVTIDDGMIEALCAIAAGLGVGSLRAPLQAVAAARASAALAGRIAVEEPDLALAAELVLAPRATRPPEPPPTDEEPEGGERPEDAAGPEDPSDLADRVLDAVRGFIPQDLLQAEVVGRGEGRRRGASRAPAPRGRRVGVRRGKPGPGRRLDVLDTVRAAAPWQRLRGRDGQQVGERLRIRGSDFRIQRLVARSGTTVIFAIDASGSSAMHRLAEAKGAVELLLAQSYVRRDRVALLSFRRTTAELLLPPTRSLTRARRALAALPGGGGTPLAAGLDAARTLAAGLKRAAGAGGMPLLVLLTDGRPNVSRDGTGGRPRAEADALDTARAIGRDRIPAVVIDTSPRGAASGFAPRLAREMAARLVALPTAAAAEVSGIVRAAMDGG